MRRAHAEGSGPPVRIEVVQPGDLAGRAAEVVAETVRVVVASRGTCSVAFSGGRTPAGMLDHLVGLDVPWEAVEVFQVDERAAPDGHPERNLTLLAERLLERVPIPAGNVHPIPVADRDVEDAARRYGQRLVRLRGDPPVLDLVHLGLGTDGHTASLFPGDPAIEVTDRPAAATRSHAARRRVTLTLPTLNRAGTILWLVAGGGKAGMVRRLVGGDRSIPAGRVRRERAILLADTAAAARLGTA